MEEGKLIWGERGTTFLIHKSAHLLSPLGVFPIANMQLMLKEVMRMGYLKVKQSKKPAISICRDAITTEKLVYVAVANKPLSYAYGKSRIAYIGTTKRGAHRIAESAAKQARELLKNHGVTQLEFFIVSCRGRQRLQSWRKLERALLLVFREKMGQAPTGNKQGKGIAESDEWKFFNREKLVDILDMHR